MTFAEYLYELYILQSRHEDLDQIDEKRFAEMFQPIELDSTNNKVPNLGQDCQK